MAVGKGGAPVVSLASEAMRYATKGWAVFPLVSRSKLPRVGKKDGGRGCYDGTADTATVAAWWDRWPEANIGLHCGAPSGVWVLDIDAKAPESDPGEPVHATGPEAVAALEALYGPLPVTRTASTGGGGEHRYFVMPAGRTIKNRARIRLPDGRRTGLDVRAEGGYVVLPPSVHPDGPVYAWGGPATIAEAPAWLLDLVDPPKSERSAAVVVLPPLGREADGLQRYGAKALIAACRAIENAAESNRHDTIYRESAAIGELVAGGCVGEDDAETSLVSAGIGSGKSEREVRRTVRHALGRGMQNPRRPEPREMPQGQGRQAPRRQAWEEGPPAWMDAGPPVDVPGPADMTIIEGAEPTYDPAPRGAAPRGDGDGADRRGGGHRRADEGGPDGGEVERYRLTDLGNARRFVALHGEDVRWCGAMPGTGWMLWDDSRWRIDDTKTVQRLATTVAQAWRDDAEEIPKPKGDPDGWTVDDKAANKRRKKLLAWSMRCESAGGLRAINEVAGFQPEVAVRKEAWDADPFLFNTPGLTLDLRRGAYYEPRRADYITRVGGVGAIAEGSTCPTWLAFLDRIMGGDQELVAFLQRVCGYCLTGSTVEQCMFIAYGSGRNGKSTFMEAVRHVLGDYARNTPIETFVGRREGGIPNDLAALAGARMVTCSEPPEGGCLNEGLVKLASGDDVITARFLNREFFDFLPAFKLWMLTNHKPIIKGTDNGIWRRLRMIPFTVTIPENEVDRDLGRKLKAEAAGILQWMVDGCADWRTMGLAPPGAVTAATSEYRAEMDLVRRFLDERTESAPGGTVTNAGLYAAFSAWCTENGEWKQPHGKFSRNLIDKGYRQTGSRKNGRAWEGLSLIITTQEDMGWGRRTGPRDA